LGIARRALHKKGLQEKAKEMCNRVYTEAHSYDEALEIMGEYVEIE
jgi:hypothetical protein